MDPSLELIVLGVGDAFSERFRPTSFLLHASGAWLAVDCPDSYRAMLREAAAIADRSLPLDQVHAFVITHVHGDHVNGLEAVGFWKHFYQQRRTTVVTSPEVRADLWDRRLAAAMGTLWNGVEMRTMAFDPWDAPVTVGPFRISARRTIHHVPTSALLIEAGGRTLGFSADTAYDPGLIEFLSRADLIVHEANLGPGHTSVDKLMALPPSLRDRIRLVHTPDGFDATTNGIPVLHAGQVITV
jgi:ribonuclease BN (tRNA processing enzyme)